MQANIRSINQSTPQRRLNPSRFAANTSLSTLTSTLAAPARQTHRPFAATFCTTTPLKRVISNKNRFNAFGHQQQYHATKKMSFHFASSEYTSCFTDLPQPDVPAIRKSAIDYVNSFDEQTWYNDPVCAFFSSKTRQGKNDHTSSSNCIFFFQELIFLLFLVLFHSTDSIIVEW